MDVIGIQMAAMEPRILIITASFGEGHRQASVALQEEFQRQIPQATVRLVDFGQFMNRAFYELVRLSYIFSLRYAPFLYGSFYRRTMRIRPDSFFQRRLNSLGQHALQRFLYEYSPNLVVSTYPTPTGVMAQLRQQGFTDVPLATVITDYTVHSQWLHPAVDFYFVGADSLREGLIERGLNPSCIYASGIPVRRQFAQPLEKLQARQQLGLHPKQPVLLLMGGAFGVLPRLHKMPQLFHSLWPELQLIVICGRDGRLQRRFTQEAAQLPFGRMHVFGYVDHVDVFMAAADVIITKAGGLTVTEALARHLPLLIFRPLPGQEEQNTRFLVQAGAAVAASRLSELQRCLSELFVSPERLAQMQAAAARLARPNAAAEIVVTLQEPMWKHYHKNIQPHILC